MRKLLSVLCLSAMGMSVMAGEHPDYRSLDYSVFRGYKDMSTVDAAQVLRTQQQARDLFPGWNAVTDKVSGMFNDMFGPAVAVTGNTNLEKAQQLMSGKLAAMGINAAEWVNVRNTDAGFASYVDFEQVVNGHKVMFSTLSFRFTEDGRLQRIKMHNYGTPEQSVVPVVTENDALATAAGAQELSGYTITGKKVNSNWVWFPVPTKDGYVLKPAYECTVEGIGEYEMPFDLLCYVDATGGELLYRTDRVKQAFDVTVKGKLYKVSPLVSATDEPLQNMRITISGNNYYTNDTGLASVGSANAPVNVTYALRGRWIRATTYGGSTPSFQANMTVSGDTYIFPDTGNSSIRHLTTFYHGNIVHDFMKMRLNGFTGMDNELTANLDRPGNTCNAFYNGNSINFYNPTSGSCRAFSEVSDIVYHEYGHGISRVFYNAQGKGTMYNGAMGEGCSDVWSMAINKDGVLGEGAFISGGAIRNYTGTPKVYPIDIQGEVHADGEIIAGAWWDVAVNISSVDTMGILFAKTYFDTPDGPDGTEGSVYHDVLISALMNDDDDANLGNGTPHFKQIVEAFAKHGIYLLGDAEFKHTEVPHQKSNTAVTISGQLLLDNPAFFDKLQMIYRNRTSTTWDTVAMTNTSGNTYSAQIPGMPSGTIVDYYFTASDAINVSSYGLPKGFMPYPSYEFTLPYQFGFGIDYPRYVNNFDDDKQMLGWQLGATDDNATSGQWVRATPVASNSTDGPVQTGADHTSGKGGCLVTGNGSNAFEAPGSNDVDNGKTTVLTPMLDLPFYEPVVEYYRWYSNDRGSSSNARTDYWSVEINNGLSVFWKRVDYTKQADQQWRRRIFKVSEYFPGADKIQMRFIVEDKTQANLTNNGQDIVDGAIDDFVIYEGAPLGVDNVKVNRAEIYPNPADDVVNIVVNDGSKGSISVMDMTGKVIAKVEVTEGNSRYAINTSGIAAGTYIVLVQTQYAIQSSRVAVSHK